MVSKIEVTIDVIVHATEDIEKFYEAFEDIFNLKKEEFTIQNLSGHFDNPIIILGTKLVKKSGRNFLKTLISKLPKGELDYLIKDIKNRIDDSSLHIRISKQQFIKRRLEIDEKNAIKIKIYTPVYVKKEIAESYTEMLRGVD